jgi:hypothetical protein
MSAAFILEPVSMVANKNKPLNFVIKKKLTVPQGVKLCSDKASSSLTFLFKKKEHFLSLTNAEQQSLCLLFTKLLVSMTFYF